MTSNIGHPLLGASTGVLPASLAQEMAANGNFHDNREALHDYIYSKLLLGEDNSTGGGVVVDGNATNSNNVGGVNVNATATSNLNIHHTLANSVPVFPTTLMTNYASSMAPQGPPPPHPPPPPTMTAVDFTLHNSNSHHNNNHGTHNNAGGNDMGGVVVVGNVAHNNNVNNIHTTSSSQQEQSSHHLDMSNVSTIPSTPQVSTLKPKKKSHHKNAGGLNHHHHANHHQQQQQQHHQLSGGLTQINVPNHEGIMGAAAASSSSHKSKKYKGPKQKKDKVNFCDVCGRGFAERYTLNRHMMTHTHVKPYSCTKCNMAFSRSDGLAKHMKAGHRRVDAHHCDVCGGTFNSELSFEQHKREYGTTLPFVCNLCMLAFSQCCHLNYHMKSHALKSDYGVEVTAETLGDPVDPDSLVPEDFTSPKAKDSNPHKINMAAVLSASLNPDIRIKHEIDDNFPYANSGGEGKPPGNGFQNNAGGGNAGSSDMSAAITNAIAVATGVSGNGTPTGSSMLPGGGGSSSDKSASISELDMKKYYDIKVPNPRFMDGGGTSSSSTTTTTITNSDGTTTTQPITLFRCHICGKGFTRKYHMQRHVRLHTRGPVPRAHLLDWTRRPYACGVCKMGFTRQHHLTRHMLIHTGERPHSCHICGKAFRRYTNLSLHVRTVHGSERPFKCPICGRGFPRVYSLQRHLNTHGKNSDAQLLMNAGLLPLPKKGEDAKMADDDDVDGGDKDSQQEQQQYLTLSNAKIMTTGNQMQHRDALLSDGSDAESSSTTATHHPHHHLHPHPHAHQHQHRGQGSLVVDAARQSEIDRINASIEDTIGAVIKGAMSQGGGGGGGGTKKPRNKKSLTTSSSASTASHHPPHQQQQQQHHHQQQHNHHQQPSSSSTTTTTNPSSNANNPHPSMHNTSDQMINLSLQQQQQQQQQQPPQHTTEVLPQHHQHQQIHHHQQQQQHHHQHPRHLLSLSQDNSQQQQQQQQQQHDLALAQQQQQHQRSTGNFNDLSSMRASTPSSSSFHLQQQQTSGNQDRSTTPFTLNQQQQQQLPPNDGSRPASAYAIVHLPNNDTSANNKAGSAASYSNQPTISSATDRSSTPYSHHHHHQQQQTTSNLADRSSTPFILTQQQQPGNLDAATFQASTTSNIQTTASPIIIATAVPSSRAAQNQQQQQQQQLQQLVAQLDTRSDASGIVRTTGDPIIFAHPASTNGFQFPMGTTMDLSTNQRSRLVVGGTTNPASNTPTPVLRQAGPTEFGHNLTLGQTALNLNAEAAAFAHVQATNNLSTLFPGNATTLTFHQQQLMGEALSRLDMELQAAHQGTAGQLPATSLSGNNTGSATSRPY